MVAAPLLFASVVDVLMGALFAYAGVAIARRPVGPEARLASRGFSLWWYAVGTLVVIEGARGIVASFDLLSRPFATNVFLALWFLWIALLGAAMWGLLVYLTYIYRGTDRAAWPLALFYGAWSALAIWQTAIAGPLFTPGNYTTLVTYETPLAKWAELAFFLFLYVPQIGAIALYLRLYTRVGPREARTRMLAIGLGLAAWIGSNLVVALLDVIETDAWQIAKRVIGLVVSILILATYAPPAPASRPPSARELALRSDAMAARLRELI